MRSIKFSAMTLCILSMLYACSNETAKKESTAADGKQVTDAIADKAPIKAPQTVEERVKDIKDWFAQVQTIGKKNCITKSNVSNESFNEDGEPYRIERKANICNLSDDYELITLDFLEPYSGSQTSIYKRQGKIFFVFITSGDGAWSSEERFYCDENENVIQLLHRENNDPNIGPQETMPLNASAPNIRSYISNDVREIENLLKRKI